jgi:hypothetical protein
MRKNCANWSVSSRSRVETQAPAVPATLSKIVAQEPGLKCGLIHPPSTAVHRKPRAAHPRRSRTMAASGERRSACWKAWWGQPLASSNLASSAAMTCDDAKPLAAAHGCWGLLVSVCLIRSFRPRPLRPAARREDRRSRPGRSARTAGRSSGGRAPRRSGGPSPAKDPACHGRDPASVGKPGVRICVCAQRELVPPAGARQGRGDWRHLRVVCALAAEMPGPLRGLACSQVRRPVASGLAAGAPG